MRMSTRVCSLTCFGLLAAVSFGADDLKPIVAFKKSGQESDFVAFTPGGVVISAEGKLGQIRAWDKTTGESKVISDLRGPYVVLGDGTLFGVAEPEKGDLIGAHHIKSVALKDLDAGKELAPEDLLGTSPPTLMAFSPDRKTLAVATENVGATYLALFDSDSSNLIEGPKPPRDKEGRTTTFTCAAFSPDGNTLVCGTARGVVTLYKTVTMRERQAIEAHAAKVIGLAVSPDSKTLATIGDGDKDVKLWDLSDGKDKGALKGHEEAVTCLAFSADGKCLATGGADHTVKIWDAASGKELLTIEAHLLPVTCLAFSADGKSLVTGSEDKTVKVWDLAKALGH